MDPDSECVQNNAICFTTWRQYILKYSWINTTRVSLRRSNEHVASGQRSRPYYVKNSCEDDKDSRPEISRKYDRHLCHFWTQSMCCMFLCGAAPSVTSPKITVGWTIPAIVHLSSYVILLPHLFPLTQTRGLLLNATRWLSQILKENRYRLVGHYRHGCCLRLCFETQIPAIFVGRGRYR